MEEERYWCHACCRVVNPIMELESMKCSQCQGGLSDLQRWAPIFLGMLNSNPHGFRGLEEEEDSEQHTGLDDDETNGEEDGEVIRRRRSSNVAILYHLLHGILQASMNNVQEVSRGENNRLILITPQTIVVQGGTGNPFDLTNSFPYGLEQLLSENDPNRYGTPPAKKEAVEEMPTIKIKDNPIQCCVCLEEIEVGAEARQMPCKHRFHGDCILPWLQIHSSCPVCRYQLPADESKVEQDGSSSNGGNNEERRFSISLPWLFSNWLSPSSSPRVQEPDPREDNH